MPEPSPNPKRVQKGENKAQKQPLTIVPVPLMHEFHPQCTRLAKAVKLVTSLEFYFIVEQKSPTVVPLVPMLFSAMGLVSEI